MANGDDYRWLTLNMNTWKVRYNRTAGQLKHKLRNIPRRLLTMLKGIKLHLLALPVVS